MKEIATCHHSKFQLSIESITNHIYNYQCLSLLCFIMKSVLVVAIANMDIWRHFFLASYITQVLRYSVLQVSNLESHFFMLRLLELISYNLLSVKRIMAVVSGECVVCIKVNRKG